MKKSQKSNKIEFMMFIIMFGIMNSACGKTDINTGLNVDISTEIAVDNDTNVDMSHDTYAGEVYKDIEPLDLKNEYDVLNVATYITKIDDNYFISDCYHDQILYNDNLSDNISEWKVLTNQVHYAHTIATDGQVMVADDTENNRVVIFRRCADGRFAMSQTIEGIGMKPHYVQYDAENEVFMVWSSITGEMYYIKKVSENEILEVEKVLKIDELFGVYVRSFSIIEDKIYFVSGHNNQKIIKADKNTLNIEEYYEVPDKIAGMVQLSKIQDYYYITVSTDNTENQDYATIIRTKDLTSLVKGDYEDIYDKFGNLGGTPYYITCMDGKYYMSHHRTSENIISFEVIDNEIGNIQVLY